MITAVAALVESFYGNPPKYSEEQMFDGLSIIKNGKGESCLLIEVIILKKITSIKFSFIPRPKKFKDIWISDFEGYGEEITITDSNGISFRFLHNKERIELSFSSKEEYEKIGDCIDGTLCKRFVLEDERPYKVNLLTCNWIKMDWENRV